MGTTISSVSSPESDEDVSAVDLLIAFLDQKPLRMANMLKVTRIINDSSPEEKLQLYRGGVITRICKLIAELGSVNKNRDEMENEMDKKKRMRKASEAQKPHRGTGFGYGSTRSRWDIERMVEERLAREEHITWLLNAVTAFIYCASPDFSDDEHLRFMDHNPVHLVPSAVKEIGESGIIPLLEYHLNNDSVFDISEHMELYQALLETAAAMSVVPDLVPYLVRKQHSTSKSIAKEMVPHFCSAIASYPETFKNQMGSPDFRLIDFITKAERYSQVLINAARRHERGIPVEQRIRTAIRRPHRSPNDDSILCRQMECYYLLHQDQHDTSLYEKVLKPLQINSFRFIGDYGKLVVPFTFKKEVRNSNPFSPSMKERTKRIAKELASLHSTLPLNACNSIYICIDEGRCDIVKALVSGPDDTPYQNGLFEFDIFFPSSYPFSPPKFAFLTTGNGNVRFNPNLYNDGKICLSILGTWEGRPEEKWNPYCSLLQILISIQGLIFVKEPYFNEPGFEKYQGTMRGKECSRNYNHQIEHATLTYAIRDQLHNGPEYFQQVIKRHLWIKRFGVIEQANKWLSNVRRDAEDNESFSKQKDSSLIDTSLLQEKTVLQLIEDLNCMQCPCGQC